MNIFQRTFAAIPIATALSLPGCALPVREPAVPAVLTEQAEVPGLPGVRYFVRDEMPLFTRDAVESFYRERAYRASLGQTASLPPAEFLALSGGGDNGAFGAGLLCGWTAAGTRPEFKAVTGISTGALIAPFAFLGPAYDGALKDVYTRSKPKDILEPRALVTAIFEDALADNAPLKRLVKEHVTPDMLAAIAREHAKGRILLVATTDLDASRSVIWNMTKIAASGSPKALELFHKIMIASAAIPGAFPPVMIDVVANGKPYQEMHVDGGAMAQVFLYPPSLKVAEESKREKLVRERKLYIIRNARLDPRWADVERRTFSIAERAIDALIQTQGVGDLYKIYAETQRDGIDYNLAYIPQWFYAPHRENFDTKYMRKLFATGYEIAARGYPWRHMPPGL
jgi:hypothetical protein